jgi:cytoskeletal protein RodZ
MDRLLVSTIGAVARPPEDFNNQPTRYRDVNPGDRAAPGEPPPPAPEQFEPPLDPLDEETEPTAWYRRPVVLIGWGLMVLILIALIVYGIIQLVEDQGSGGTPSTTTTPSLTPTTTTTTTTTPPPSSTTTTTTTAPPTSSAAVQPPATHQPTQEPTHRHHWPSWLPTTIPALP